jgi:WD40 repeat protein
MDQAGSVAPERTGDDPNLGCDVFISYAREDRPFVGRLHDALSADGRQAWVDWEGIPASAKWMAEVRSAIDAAQAFCFVISPDSVESAVCREEAAHAAASSKRIVPVLVRSVDDGLVPEPVAVHNWIDFSDRRHFDEAFQTLVDAIAVDPDWTRTHTRLLVRAKEWDQADRDRAGLLRGADLTAAESWLASAEGKDLRPTTLQTAYMLASRKAATRRQRAAIGVIAGVLAMALALSTFALVQAHTAERQRAEALQARAQAVSEASIARSRELAGASQGNLAVDPELSLLLAIEAADASHTQQAESALRNALNASLVRVAYRHSGSVWSVAASDDGSLIAGGWDDGTVVVLDAKTGKLTESVRAGPPGHGVELVAFGPPGILMTAVSRDRTYRSNRVTATVWDLKTGKALMSAPHRRRFQPARFNADELLDWGPRISSDGRRLVTVVGPTATVWDTASGRVVTSVRQSGQILGIDLSPNGKLLATAGKDGTVGVWSVPAGHQVGLLRPRWRGSSAHERPWAGVVAFNPAGDTLMVGTYGLDSYRVGSWRHRVVSQVWDQGHPRFPGLRGMSRGTTYRTPVDFIDYAGDNLLVAHDGRLTTVDPNTGRRSRTVGLAPELVSPEAGRSPNGVAVNADQVTIRPRYGQVAAQLLQKDYFTQIAFAGRSHMVTGDDSGALKLWQTTPPTRTVHIEQPAEASLSNDGDTLTVAGQDGVVSIIDTTTLTVRARLAAGATCHTNCYGTRFSASGDGQVVVTSADETSGATFDDTVVRSWDGADGHLLFQSHISPTAFSEAVVSDDGSTVAIDHRHAVVILDSRTGHLLRTIRVPEAYSWGVALSSDGSRLLTASSRGQTTWFTLRLWDTTTGQRVGERRLDDGRFMTYPDTLAIAPDGRHVLVSYEFRGAGRAIIWDGEANSIVASRRSGLGRDGAVFSPDGTSVAAVTDDVLEVWDTATGALMTTAQGSGNLTNPQFSPGGRLVIAQGDGGYGFAVWDAATGAEVTASPDAYHTCATLDSAGQVITCDISRLTARPCDACGTFDELLALARTRVTREMSPDERAIYLTR